MSFDFDDIKDVKQAYQDKLAEIKTVESDFKKFGEADAKVKIQNLENYVSAKGARYKSHYSTILMWFDRDEKNKLKADKDYTTDTLF